MRAVGHVWSRKGNLAKAELWYARAAEHGDAASMFHLAWIYEQAGQADYLAAIRTISDQARTDALMEGPDAARKLLPQDNFIRAADWYRKSDDNGFAPAMNKLGELYLACMGVRQDASAAHHWHLASARAGNPVAAINTALDFRIARGVGADLAQAEKWSSWTGKPNAAGLGDLTLERTNVFGNGVPARERALIRAAADQGVPVTTALKPIKPNPNLPTFSQVRKQLEE
jgi:TPR repeat protein